MPQCQRACACHACASMHASLKGPLTDFLSDDARYESVVKNLRARSNAMQKIRPLQGGTISFLKKFLEPISKRKFGPESLITGNGNVQNFCGKHFLRVRV